MKRIPTITLRTGALVAVALLGAASAWAQDGSRGVRIIDGPDITPQQPAPMPSPAVPAPVSPAPAPPVVATPSPPAIPVPPQPQLAPPQLAAPEPVPLPAPTASAPLAPLAPAAAPMSPPQLATPNPTPPAPAVPPPAQLATPAPAPVQPSTSSLPPLVPPTASLPPLVPPTSAPPPLVTPPQPVPDTASIQPVAPVTPPPAPATPEPNVAAPTPAQPPTYDTSSLPPTPGQVTPPSGPTKLPTIDSTIAISNPAELVVEILPGNDLKVGARVSFRITTKKPGYLILVDVDSSGKLSQIFPNPLSLLTATADRLNPHANFIKPGSPIHLPDPKSAITGGYEFVASPPLGTAMVVAILSDRPVQLVDLPDVPTALVGQAAALAYLNKVAGELRLPPADGNGPLLEPKWSLDAKFYAIR